MKKLIAITLAGVVGLSGLVISNFAQDNRPVLKVANWAEYIDPGDSEEDIKSLVEEFEIWYQEVTGNPIRVEYCIADDNEILYNMIKMGDHFDLVCPSEYMLMKLAAENRLQKLPTTFFDVSNEYNYYAINVSPYIKSVFDEGTLHDGSRWSEYSAGYMWGTTGFVYNPEEVDENDVKSWNVFTNTSYNKKITAKNNIRDSYFTGLGMYYEEELLTLRTQYETGILPYSEYHALLSQKMNDTSSETMNAVKQKMMSMTRNLYGFETDEGKKDTISGKVTVNYQWSGDAVYIMDMAEGYDPDTPIDEPLYLNYCIPDSVSNLWFDGWAIMKDCKDVDAATMFINFLSRPDNAVRNMNYIGYTSCIGSDEVFEDFTLDYYEAEEDDETAVLYDLNYYFNPNYIKGDPSTIDESYIFYTPEDQIKRQLFAQYPDENTLSRCVTMQYFNADANSRANSMWSDITFF